MAKGNQLQELVQQIEDLIADLAIAKDSEIENLSGPTEPNMGNVIGLSAEREERPPV